MNARLRRRIESLVVSVIVVSMRSAVAQEVDLFRTTPAYDVGDGPTAIVSCDLNQDGWPDVVTANELFDDIAVLLNDQAGSFFPQVRFGVGPAPIDLACVDLDNDEKLDVVTLNSGADTLSILRGNGDGTFAVATITISLPVNGSVKAIAVGRLDGDDSADIVVVADEKHVLLFGPPGFDTPKTYTIVHEPLGSDVVNIADLDGDEKLDVVTEAWVAWGNGDRSFDVDPLNILAIATSIVAGHMNGDSNLDLLYSTLDDVRILRGLGSRSFAGFVSVDVGPGASQLKVRDVNGDGRIDILTSNQDTNDVTVRLGRGDLTFETEVRFGVADDPSRMVVEDFDRDGKLDVATSNYASNDVSLMLGNGDGTFRWEPRFPVDTNPRSVAACDLNHDGIVDLASANQDENTVSVLIGLGGGSYLPGVRYPTAETPVAIACADIKKDGHPDLVVANRLSSEISVLLGIGDGTFLSKPRFSVGPGPRDLDVCDFNEDGHLDVVTANGSTLSILLGQGNGFFLPETRLGDRADLVVCADVNGDEHDDLIYVFDGDIVVQYGDGEGAFSSRLARQSSYAPSGLFVANMNDDAFPDAVVVSNSRSEWRWHRGNVLGGFDNANIFSAGNGPRSALVYDVDGDDAMDVLITNSGSDDVSVFLGDGFGNFEDERRFGVGEQPWMSIASDVDNDGDDDLIVANSVSNSLSVLFNTAIELPVDPNDVDGDGIPNDFDNCPDVSNVTQSDFDDDGVGDACDPDIDNDGVFNGPDVCDFTPVAAIVQPDGGLRADADNDCDVDLDDYSITQQEFTGPPSPHPPQVLVWIQPDGGEPFPCEEITLTATTSPDTAGVAWTSIGGTPGDFVDNGDGTATFRAPIEPDAGLQVLTFEATASQGGYNPGVATVTFTLRDFDADHQVATESSGAALSAALSGDPETVTLKLDDNGTDGDWTAVWEADAGNVTPVTLTADGPRQATFPAPDVLTTTDLAFTATVSGCPLGTLTGTVIVPIQFAAVTLDFSSVLPVGDEVTVGTPLIISDFMTITGIDPADPEVDVLFFAAEPGDGSLPPGVAIDPFDAETGEMTVTAGDDGTIIEITVKVVSTAGMLATGSDLLTIRAAP